MVRARGRSKLAQTEDLQSPAPDEAIAIALTRALWRRALVRTASDLPRRREYWVMGGIFRPEAPHVVTLRDDSASAGEMKLASS
jgi:hypothetical protein